MRSIERGGAERAVATVGSDVHPARHLCDRDAVVAAAHGDDARVALGLAEGYELVRHAARLEGPRPLEQASSLSVVGTPSDAVVPALATVGVRWT